MNIEKLSMEVAVKLTQDPHRTRDGDREKVLEVAIGREVRAFRRQQEITVAELSGVTGLSVGMLSKIENGNTSPSLTTLQTLANALSVPPRQLSGHHRGAVGHRPAGSVQPSDPRLVRKLQAGDGLSKAAMTRCRM